MSHLPMVHLHKEMRTLNVLKALGDLFGWGRINWGTQHLVLTCVQCDLDDSTTTNSCRVSPHLAVYIQCGYVWQ